jgi:hypothetical protein
MCMMIDQADPFEIALRDRVRPHAFTVTSPGVVSPADGRPTHHAGTLINVLPHVTATRYVTPLREGGSLPGLMEADDLGTYVVKFRGAGQGPKALVAEVIAGQLARGLGLNVPDMVTVTVLPALAGAEPDQEVQDLLRSSAGVNLGVDFLPGALDFDPVAFPVDPHLAGRVLWFDAFVANMDRSRRNPNLLQWRDLWLIDHGATLTFHHRWPGAAGSDDRAYDASDHVLAGSAPDVLAADAEFAKLSESLVRHSVDAVPAEWLGDEPGFDSVEQVRSAYVDRLLGRLRARQAWVPALVKSVAHPRVVRPDPGRHRWLAGGGP